MLEFQWPWMFVLLILPLFVYRWARPVSATAASLVIPFLDEMMSEDLVGRKGLLQKALLLLAWSLLIVALAKPIVRDEVANLPISSRNIIVAVDLSGSMVQQDFLLGGSKISRLAATKKVAAEFIEKRLGDRIGLILFADHAYLQAPLTRDLKTVLMLLDEVELGLAGDRTALGDAIGLAVKKVQEKPDQQHVLVLMTDGAATVGINVKEATRFASKVGLKIYTIGVGSITAKEAQAVNRNSIKRNGKAIVSDLDEPTLKAIAKDTGGLYFRAKNTEQLESIYSKLDELEPVIDLSKAWHVVKDLFYIPLALSLLVLVILALIRSFGTYLGRETHV